MFDTGLSNAVAIENARFWNQVDPSLMFDPPMLHGDITYVDEALYEDKLSVVFDDLTAARQTQNLIREFIRNHPTVYCGTHTPQGYENLEAKRVMNLDEPVPTMFAEVDFSAHQASGWAK